ncbi:MAG: sugar ABC transporter substrate-binding protein [Nocardioidaceae bacterium]|nr:sugar ABC transporter substrate-binding protein [Nocardioidaceae bacterium]
MRARRWGAAIGAALVCAVGAGCGAGAVGDDGDAVRVLLFGEPEELGAYRELIDEFEAGSDTEVELIEASDRDDLIARLSTSIAGGEPPDVFLLNYRYYGQFAATGSIEPLDDRLAASAELSADELYPVAMDAFNWQGEQLCLPQNVSSLAVYYNRTLFERYGVAEPPNEWTWNDLLQTAVTLTRDANGNQVIGTESDGAQVVDVYGLGIEASVIRLAPLVWSNGGEIVDDSEQPTRFTFDQPEARAVLRDFLDLRLAYGVVPTDAEIEAEDDETRFANGGLAMLLSSRRATTTFRSITDFDWDVAPLPTYGREAGILHSDAYCITSQSVQQDEAWEFVEFALSETGQRALVETGRTVPSNIEVSRSDAFLDSGLPPSRSQVFLDSIDVVRPVPTISTWPEIEDVTTSILEDALYKGMTVDETARLLDQETRELFARGETP